MVLDLFFWAFYGAFCLHVVEEALLSGGFVAMVQRDYWPTYSWQRFAWFNTAIFALYAASIFLLELAGPNWLLVPLSISWFFVVNGLWHLERTALTRRFAPGLITGQLYWIIMYMGFRYVFGPSQVSPLTIWLAALIGLIAHTAMIASLQLAPRLFGSKRP